MLPVAYLALVLFLPFALAVFGRLPRASATVLVVLAGTLLLPPNVAFDIPGLPPLDREYVTYLSLFLAAAFYRRRALVSSRPGTGPEVFVLFAALANVGTIRVNASPTWNGDVLESGLGAYAWIANTGDDVLTLGLTFFLGRALIRSRDDLRVLLSMLALAGVVYTGLIFIEVGMSLPFRVFQLTDRIYGVPIVPDWRWGVIQPIVFLGSPLAVATYMASALIASGSLVRAGARMAFVGPRFARAILALGLFMSRNVAGNVYGWTMTTAIAFVPIRVFAAASVGLAILAVSYPALCMADLFPREAILELASAFDPERARSLRGRFDEEAFVLGNIGERLWFGWGSFDRIPGAAAFGEGETGLDAWWVIRTGTHGIIGLELYYAVLVLPVLIAWRRLRLFRDPRDAVLVSALMAIVAIRCIDLLLNGWWNHLPVFLAGALYGVTKPRRARAAVKPPRSP